MLLTGVDDTDREILLRVNVRTLGSFDLVNKRAVSLLTPSFWRERFIREYGVVDRLPWEKYRWHLLSLAHLEGTKLFSYLVKNGLVVLLRSLWNAQPDHFEDRAFVRHLLGLALAYNQPSSVETIFSFIPPSEHEGFINNRLFFYRCYIHGREGMRAMISIALANSYFDFEHQTLTFRTAAKYALTEEVQTIMQRVKVWDVDRHDALMWLIKRGRYKTQEDRLACLATIKVLLNRGMPMDESAIAWAAARGMLEVVEYLWHCGCSLNTCDEAPLRRAARYGHLDVVKFIVENSNASEIDLQAQRNYAIIYAQNNGCMEVATYLRKAMVERGLDPDLYRSNRKGETKDYYY